MQGIIYSETAAANYHDDPVFEISTEYVPAQRLGTPEEVEIRINNKIPYKTLFSIVVFRKYKCFWIFRILNKYVNIY